MRNVLRPSFAYASSELFHRPCGRDDGRLSYEEIHDYDLACAVFVALLDAEGQVADLVILGRSSTGARERDCADGRARV